MVPPFFTFYGIFMNKNIKAYMTIANNDLHGADFEKRWYESVITVLIKIQNNVYEPVETHKKLIEVCDGLGWIQENLNEQLSSQYRSLLKQIYSVNIKIINSTIETKNTQYLDIVISSLKTIMEGYKNKS